jgi:hypothetical protein
MNQVAVSGVAAAVEPAVRLVDVSRTYGRGEVAVRALCGVTMDVVAASFVVCLGPSRA